MIGKEVNANYANEFDDLINRNKSREDTMASNIIENVLNANFANKRMTRKGV